MRATFGISRCIVTRPFIRMVDLVGLYQLGTKSWHTPPFESIVFNTRDTGDNFNCYAHFEMAAGFSGNVEALMNQSTMYISVNGQEHSSKNSGWTYQNNIRVAAYPFPYLPPNQEVTVKLLRIVDKDGVVRWSNE